MQEYSQRVRHIARPSALQARPLIWTLDLRRRHHQTAIAQLSRFGMLRRATPQRRAMRQWAAPLNVLKHAQPGVAYCDALYGIFRCHLRKGRMTPRVRTGQKDVEWHRGFGVSA